MAAEEYPAKAIANALLYLAWGNGALVDHMKLQKLVFLAHGWAAGILDRKLISDRVEAWDYGPVIPVLYHEFKGFGARPITRPALDEPSVELDAATQELLRRTWGAYGRRTALELSAFTHQEGSPWQMTKFRNPTARGPEIPWNLIREYFHQMVQQFRAKRLDSLQ